MIFHMKYLISRLLAFLLKKTHTKFHLYYEISFLGAFCYKGKLIFLKFT
jgi:hypothetical protein